MDNGYLLKTKEAKEVLKKLNYLQKIQGNVKYCKLLMAPNLKIIYWKFMVIIKILNSFIIPLIILKLMGLQKQFKKIRKFIYTEFFKNKENFDIEEELFNISKIHNNKIHSTTKRIPREIRDLEDNDEIENINKEIVSSLSKLKENYNIIDYNKSYVIDYNKIYVSNVKIYKKKES